MFNIHAWEAGSVVPMFLRDHPLFWGSYYLWSPLFAMFIFIKEVLNMR